MLPVKEWAPRLLVTAVLSAVLVSPCSSQAHDASAYGGVFRTRNLGQAWLNADAGLFLNAALTVAVSPRDPSALLLGTDTGLLRSRNGGQSWTPEASGMVVGAVFAIAFAPDGHSALCAASGGVFRFDGEHWQQAAAPGGAVPARAAAFGTVPGRAYLLGQGGVFRSDDGGRSFAATRSTPGNGAEITALLVSEADGETLLALAGGALWVSADAGTHWVRRTGTAPFDAAVVDALVPHRVWAASSGTLAVSDDLGQSWREAAELPDHVSSVRGIAAGSEATVLVVAADAGMFRSADGGKTWAAESGTLPAHLAAGPLFRVPGDPRTLYTVYSLIPYGDVWRTAVEGSTLLSRVGPAQIAGAGAFMLFLVLSGVVLVRWLARAPHALQPR